MPVLPQLAISYLQKSSLRHHGRHALQAKGSVTCKLRRIYLLRSSLHRETEMPKRPFGGEVASLLNGYILPSLAKRGGQGMVS